MDAVKRFFALSLTVVLLCGLTACRSSDYLSVQEHQDPFSYKETTVEDTQEQELRVSDYYSLRTALISLMTQGEEHAQVYLDGYSGNADNDLKRVVSYLTESDPVGAYAIDYINYERQRTPGSNAVLFDVVYRRSANEIAAIRSVRGNEQANSVLYTALEEFAPSVTLQISGYTEEDFAQTVREYCLYHPEKTVPCSDLSVSVYPQSGNVRVVEFHFSYDLSREDLRIRTGDTATALSSAYNYIRYGQSAEDCLKLTLSYLIGRFPYKESEDASVYSLLCEGVSDSTAFSSVLAYLCRNAKIPCFVVEGTKQGIPYCWTVLQIDGVWYHLDLARNVLEENRTLLLMTDSEMLGYDWDSEKYPVCDGIPEEPPTEPENG